MFRGLVFGVVLQLCCCAVLSAEQPELIEEVEDWHGVTFVRIPAGQFAMGSSDSVAELERAGIIVPEGISLADEAPVHPVRVSAFRLGKYEVTRGQFRIFVEATGYTTDAEKDLRGGWGIDRQLRKAEQSAKYSWRNPGFPQTDNHPVVNVSWNDATAYCRWLTDEYARRGMQVECGLPTEAEWEYACRAGTTTQFAKGDSPLSLIGSANVRDASFEAEFPLEDFEKRPSFPFNDGNAFTAVGGKYKANAFGLHDMHGNVWEWCADWYDPQYYSRAVDMDPRGPQSGTTRVIRGGAWDFVPRLVRCANRSSVVPENRCCYLGFRVVLR